MASQYEPPRQLSAPAQDRDTARHLVRLPSTEPHQLLQAGSLHYQLVGRNRRSAYAFLPFIGSWGMTCGRKGEEIRRGFSARVAELKKISWRLRARCQGQPLKSIIECLNSKQTRTFGFRRSSEGDLHQMLISVNFIAYYEIYKGVRDG